MLNSFDLDSLNQEQRRAVEYPLEPLLVLAGPGTGKTRTLVCRVLYLIEHYELKPEQILAVTYTNKATEEMRDRFRIALGNRACEMTVGTFHGFCIRVMRDNYEAVGLPKHFTIADEEMQIEVLSRVVRNLAPESRDKSLRNILQRLSEVRLNDSPNVKPLSNLEKQFFRDYQKELRKNCLIDFDDILVLTHQLFTEHQNILQKYQGQFAAILVDEFQDTDRLQYQIIKLLAAVHRNVFAVADDDQSIFSWRGAHPENVFEFLADFAKDKRIHLDSNYRSTEEIVAQAGRLIINNDRLAVKHLNALNGSGNPVRFVRFQNETDEAQFLMREILQAMKDNPDLRHRDFAALFARHKVGENLEQEFMKAGIPCQLVRGKSILEHDEIERALLLLRIVYNPDDQLTLERFVERELGDVAFGRLKEFQAQRGLTNFKSLLVQFAKQTETPEQERALVDQIIGNIKNLIDIKESSGDRRLSSLVSEIMTCISESRLSSLNKVVDQLSDPFELNGVHDAAKWLHEAMTAQTPIVVAANNDVLRFVAIELLTKCFPNGNFEQPTEEPSASLYLALDSAAFDQLNGQNESQVRIIYLGTELPKSLRDGESSVEMRLNPYDVPREERGLEPSVIAVLFKLCQATSCLNHAPFFPDYTALDIETTDLDTKTNEIIELAAIRVRNGVPVAEYNQLVKPNSPIAKGAQAVHGLTEEFLKDSPAFDSVISDFLEFIGDDLLVAHNGYQFDFPCIKHRLSDCAKPAFTNRTFDTLPFARRLFPGAGAGIDALASRFEIETGQRHRALDDTKCLVEIFERLKQTHDARLRKTSHEGYLDTVALGILVEHGRLYDREALLLKHGAPRIKSNSSTILASLREAFPDLQTDEIDHAVAELVESRGTDGLVSQETFGLLSRFDEIIRRFDDRPLEQAMESFLDFARLYQAQDGIEKRDAVTLITIYAAKGLEFPRVFVVGLEQGQIPSFYSTRSNDPNEIKEQRRLLYVAMTRAKEQLILTGSANRDGYPQEHSQFLRELELGYDFDSEDSSDSGKEPLANNAE